MGRKKDPRSRLQIELRARRLKDPESGWTRQVLTNLAFACLKAQGAIDYLEEAGPEAGGPEAGPFLALPEAPGERLLVGVQRLDLTTAEGLAEFRAEIEPALKESIRTGGIAALRQQAAALADPLQVQVASLLSSDFYRRHSEWIGALVAAGPQDRAGIFGSGAQDLWAVPAEPLGLAPEALLIELERALPEAREQIAANAAAWLAARELYRSAVDGKPDALGLRGLERPALLRTLLEDLGAIEPAGEKPAALEKQADGGVVRMASGAPVSVATTALMRPDRWQEDAVGALYRHDREKTRTSYELRVQQRRPAAAEADDAVLFHGLEQCREMLESRGLEVVGLHGVLCCYVAQLEDSRATIELDGRALLADLGLETARGGPAGITTSDQLKRLGSMATLLGSLWCGDGESRGRSGWVTTQQGPLWNISIRTNGISRQLDLGLGVTETMAGTTITDLTLIVSGGGWIRSHLNREALQGGEGLYQYVPVALAILQLSRYRSEMAFRLGIHLSLRYRTNPQAWRDGKLRVQVGQLLGEVLPAARMERATAKGAREAARGLRDEWMAALAVLARNVGFRFEFPSNYPVALIPVELRTPAQQAEGPAPHGALGKLLDSYLTICWPEHVVQARHASALKKVEDSQAQRNYRKVQALAAVPEKPTGAVLREEIAKLKGEGVIDNYVDLEPVLELRKGSISKLVNGKLDLPQERLDRMLSRMRAHRRNHFRAAAAARGTC